MSKIIIDKFNRASKDFLQKKDVLVGISLMEKVTSLVNELGESFSRMSGGELAERQMKLAGYKFYLAELIAEMMAKSEYLKAYCKDYKARRWKEVETEIKEEEGKVKNKEQIENVILKELYDEFNEQIFYEGEYQKLKLKSMALDDILTTLVQQIASKKREFEMTKQL